MNIALIMPAYNEEKRIANTITAYLDFFKEQPFSLDLIVVANGCRDQTIAVVDQLQKKYSNLFLIEVMQAGKGLAITKGFLYAIAADYDYIGFVDADMATKPVYFNDLISRIAKHDCDGVIASRYMPESIVYPPRPKIKRWGSKFIYEPLVRLFFGLPYHDLQCGAKLFTKKVIAKITPHLSIEQWAFDLELLYLCKKFGFTIVEIPTTWQDADQSKLRIASSGADILGAVVKLRWHHRNLH